MSGTNLVQRVEAGEHLPDGADLGLVPEELLEDALPRQLLLHLLGAGQVVVDARRLDRQRHLHHEPRLPLHLTGVLVRVVAYNKGKE